MGRCNGVTLGTEDRVAVGPQEGGAIATREEGADQFARTAAEGLLACVYG